MKINSLYRDSGVGKVLWLGVWGPINLIVAFGPLLAFNFLQFPSLFILPFSKRAFRQYNRAAGGFLWGWWAFGVQRLIGLNVERTGDEILRKEDAIVICNHQGMADVLVIICLAFGKGRIGDLKWIAKDVLKYIPGLGWGLLFLESVFVKRNWTGDRKRVLSTFEKYRLDKIPIWMCMFPEGTRFTPKKRQAAEKFARAKGIDIPGNVLIPRKKGFQAAVIGLRQHVKAIYTITIKYESKVPKLVQIIRGDIKSVKCHVSRVGISDLPVDDHEVGRWLFEEFKRMDLWLGPKPQNEIMQAE
jgi:1-acyl-sn-glycerol-3-phosphate acyltransferase